MYPHFRLLFRSLLITLSILSMAFQATWADLDAEESLQSWSVVTLRSRIKDRVLGYMEVQPRVTLVGPSGSTPNHFNALIIRPALGLQLSKSVTVWQGYGWTPSFDPKFRDEHRIFQQLLVENKFKRFGMVNRTRLEERFIQDTGNVSVRARHMLRGTLPIGGKPGKEKKWSLVTYDELFVNLNSADNGPQAGLDQNRIFAGVNRKFNKNINMEAGYLVQYINRPFLNSDKLNHVIFIGLNVVTD